MDISLWWRIKARVRSQNIAYFHTSKKKKEKFDHIVFLAWQMFYTWSKYVCLLNIFALCVSQCQV